MPGMKDLSKLMRQLENQLVVCMRCGMCQAVCPLFEQTGREADVARGKLALLDGLMQEMFKDPRGVHERVNRCLLCGSCAANCPSGVRILEIFLKARAILTGYMGLSPAKKAVFRSLLGRPKLFDRLLETGAVIQRAFARPANELLGTSCARLVSPLLSRRHFVPLARVPFHRRSTPLKPKPGRRGSGIRVAFFVGCLLDKIFPRVAQAVVDVLDHYGVAVIIPKSLACCGIPAVSAGDTQSFQQMVRHNLKRFDPETFDYLVTACATCTATIRHIWPMMVPGNDGEFAETVRKTAEKTLDISQFLVSILDLENNPDTDQNAVAVTYHDPCHLKKSLGVWEEPRQLIRANPMAKLTEMDRADACCGMGGSFNLQYYEISAEIGRKKRDLIVSTGCSVVSTGCPACMMQLSDALSKSGDPVAVKHFMEIFAERVKNYDT